MGAFADKINGVKPTFVDFHADWCGPCKMMDPVLKDVHKKLGDKISFLKVDIDKNPRAASFYQIKAVPTYILFRKGQIMWQGSGVMSSHDLEKMLTSFAA